MDYDRKTLQMANSETGVTSTIYENQKSLDRVNSIAVDYRGNIFWASGKDGKDEGSIFKASADEPSNSSIQAISKALDSAEAICYKREFLFFASKDQVTAANDTSSDDPDRESDHSYAIYYKSLPRGGETSHSIK